MRSALKITFGLFVVLGRLLGCGPGDEGNAPRASAPTVGEASSAEPPNVAAAAAASIDEASVRTHLARLTGALRPPR
jgi:hypothetical protein